MPFVHIIEIHIQHWNVVLEHTYSKQTEQKTLKGVFSVEFVYFIDKIVTHLEGNYRRFIHTHMRHDWIFGVGESWNEDEKNSNNIVCYPLNVKHWLIRLHCLLINSYELSDFRWLQCDPSRLFWMSIMVIFYRQAVNSSPSCLLFVAFKSLFEFYSVCPMRSALNFQSYGLLEFEMIKGIHAEENEQSFYQCVKG